MKHITKILSNGWPEDKHSLEDLFKVLESHPLDRSFEKYGNFIDRSPQWIEVIPGSHGYLTGHRPAPSPYPGHAVVNILGNFLTYSHVFRIHTDDPELIRRFEEAIEKNKSRDDYKRQVKP